MSTKLSDYGSLADRTGRGNETAGSAVDRPLPAGVHVWVRTDAGEVAGLLAGWRRQEDGAWWGRVILVTDGQPSETLIRADLLRKPPDPSTTASTRNMEFNGHATARLDDRP